MEQKVLIDILTKSETSYPVTIFANKNRIYTFINPYSYHLYRKNKKIYNQFDGIFVDGILMCILIRVFYSKRIRRLSCDMVGIAPDLFERLEKTNETLYIIGSTMENVSKMVDTLKHSYPNINIIGYEDGYFSSNSDRESRIEKIVMKNPDFILIGMGAIVQESFAVDLKQKGFKGIAFTCGGFIHQTAGKINYYPKWINYLQMRSLYRLYKEKGLYKRLYNCLFEFPVLFIKDKWLR